MAKKKIDFSENIDEALGSAENINSKKNEITKSQQSKTGKVGRPREDKTVKICFSVNEKTAKDIEIGMFLMHCNKTDFINLAIGEYVANHKAEFEKLQ